MKLLVLGFDHSFSRDSDGKYVNEVRKGISQLLKIMKKSIKAKPQS